MDLIGLILGLPLAPVRGVVAVIEVLRDQAERELYDPAKLRAQAQEIDSLASSGQITQDEAEELQSQLIGHIQVVPGDSAHR